MGLFGKKSSNDAKQAPLLSEKSQVGAVHVQGPGNAPMPMPNAPMMDEENERERNIENLPVAMPIEAHCVVAPTPQPTTPMNKYTVPIQYATEEQINLTRYPVQMSSCPHCHARSRTKVRTFPNLITWVLAIILLLVFWPIFWIPLIVDQMKQTDHFCASCQRKVGSVHPFDDCCERVRR